MPLRFAWLAAALGLVLAFLRRRARGDARDVAADDPRALELRRKLDESRALVDERDEFEGAETPVDRAEALDADVDRRRRAVHEEARAAVREMRAAPARRDEAR